MIGKYPYSKRSYYPHLRSDESLLYDSLLLAHPLLFDSVDFDVRVGSGQPTHEPILKQAYKDLKDLTKWRLDLVGYNDASVTIVELKTNPRAGVVGQLLCYRFLYSLKFSNSTNIKLLLVTNVLVQDLKTCLDHFRIKYIIL